MSHFAESLHPDDRPPWHQGEPIEEDEPSEVADTALTDYLGGRQPVLEPVEALLGGHHADIGEETGK